MRKIDIHIHPQPAGDATLDNYVRLMDEADVDAALVHALPGEFWDAPDVAWEDSDRAVLAACTRHPDRLFGSCSIDLRESSEHNIAKIRQYAAARFRSVKMFPNLGFDPGDEIHEPVWEAVEAHGLICFSHCGYVAGPSTDLQRRRMRLNSLTATPYHFEIPARRHPGIVFIFAHFGGSASYLETVTLCERLDNCYADSCGGWGVWVWEHRMPGLEDFPMDKFLYGTDSVGAGYADSERWWTELLTDMGRTPDELSEFFYGNAARILRIA